MGKLSAIPRVFVSSVVEGFQDYRRAAADAVREAGMEPVLVNEQFTALGSSPRNACLDAIETADVFILVVGERGGWVTPSGRLVVEEEWEHARRRMPILVFLQETTREPSADAFVARVSDYTTGHFRKGFSTPYELQAGVRGSLEGIRDHMMLEQTDLHSAFSSFARVDRHRSMEPTVRVRVVPLRAAELIDPVRLDDGTTHKELLLLAMQPQLGLYTPLEPHSASASGDEIIIEEGDERQHSGAAGRVALSSAGHITIDTRVHRPAGDAMMGFTTGMVVALELVEERLAAALTFCGAVYDKFDPYQRHQQFAFNGALMHLGYASLERAPTPRSSHTLRMADDGPLIAYRDPRTISRADLSDPQQEVSRLAALIERAARQGR